MPEESNYTKTVTNRTTNWVLICIRCGAVVEFMEAHDEFHDKLDQLGLADHVHIYGHKPAWSNATSYAMACEICGHEEVTQI